MLVEGPSEVNRSTHSSPEAVHFPPSAAPAHPTSDFSATKCRPAGPNPEVADMLGNTPKAVRCDCSAISYHISLFAAFWPEVWGVSPGDSLTREGIFRPRQLTLTAAQVWYPTTRQRIGSDDAPRGPFIVDMLHPGLFPTHMAIS